MKHYSILNVAVLTWCLKGQPDAAPVRYRWIASPWTLWLRRLPKSFLAEALMRLICSMWLVYRIQLDWWAMLLFLYKNVLELCKAMGMVALPAFPPGCHGLIDSVLEWYRSVARSWEEDHSPWSLALSLLQSSMFSTLRPGHVALCAAKNNWDWCPQDYGHQTWDLKPQDKQ